uniref:Sphingomyelin phosphodiesterase n=2 Tax=Panagrolaimus sp. JU765 TaxID=591449 RepID=A0AC34QIM1_9BILA
MKSLWLLFLLSTFVNLAITAPTNHELQSGKCTTCELIVEVAHDLLGDDALDDCIVDFANYVCAALHIEDHFVCKGMTSNFKETFIYVLKTLIVEPKEICGLLVQDCDGGFNPYNATWFLPTPGVKPPHKDPPPIPQGKPTLRVLHLSDLHVDNDYQIGAEAKCGEPLCCRPPNDGNEAKDVKTPAGKWGTIAECDSPYWLLTDMLQHIAATHKDIDYVIVSGDLESHADWDYSREGHIAKVKNITDTIKKYLPGLNVYFAVGNHEGVPIDNFGPHFTPEQFHMDWLYDTMADSWKDWVPTDQLPEVRYNGCYMKQLFPGLRLISLNNALGDTVNFYLYINQTDPDGTMTWFFEQLEDAERNGQKVQVVAHIPGGGGEALEGWAINYYNAATRYEDTIVGHFFGHTHSEEIHVIFEDPENPNSRPTGVVYASPSLTPYSDLNPAYRIYTIDGNYPGSTFQVIDFEGYFLNLTEANANPDAPTKWQPYYKSNSVKAEYGLKSLAASEWNNLIDRMITDNATFTSFIKNTYRRSDVKCNTDCRRNTLCDSKKAHHSQNLCSGIEAALGKAVPKVKNLKYGRGQIKSEIAFKLQNKKEAVEYFKTLAKNFASSPDKCKI